MQCGVIQEESLENLPYCPNMPTSRARLGVMATVLGLIAVLGVVWLVRSATTGSQKTSGSGATTTDSTATSDATDGGTTGSGKTTGSGETTGSATGDGSRTPGGGKTAGGGGRSVSLNGLRLDGGDDGNGCVMFMNTYGTAAHIESVSFTVTHGPTGPGSPALRSDNAAHCPKTSTCDGARLVKGGQCEAGTVFPSDAQAGEYTIDALATFTFLCDNATTEPCKHASKAGSPPPTPRTLY